ncbi:MAG: hypothetical protein LH480_07670 [Rubrivivax sp.]|nr:hypothetical protein [Rubrivivax sp.]
MASDKVLQAACAGTVVFGAVLMLAPGLARAGFSLLMFGDAAVIDAWPAAARSHATLLHGVLGAVMVGWGLALWLLIRGPVDARRGWQIVAVSVLAWYVPDSVFSLAAVALPNVALKTAFLLPYAAGLWLARPRPSPQAQPSEA